MIEASKKMPRSLNDPEDHCQSVKEQDRVSNELIPFFPREKEKEVQDNSRAICFCSSSSKTRQWITTMFASPGAWG